MRLNFISQSKMDKLTLHWAACLSCCISSSMLSGIEWGFLWENKFCRTFFSPYLLTQGKRIWCIRLPTSIFSPVFEWLAILSLQYLRQCCAYFSRPPLFPCPSPDLWPGLFTPSVLPPICMHSNTMGFKVPPIQVLKSVLSNWPSDLDIQDMLHQNQALHEVSIANVTQTWSRAQKVFNRKYRRNTLRLRNIWTKWKKGRKGEDHVKETPSEENSSQNFDFYFKSDDVSPVNSCSMHFALE